MYDKELVIEIFQNIAWSLDQISKRFQSIQSGDDFLKDESQAQFISCDDRLIKKCLTHKISVWCGNSVAFCEKEQLK